MARSDRRRVRASHGARASQSDVVSLSTSCSISHWARRCRPGGAPRAVYTARSSQARSRSDEAIGGAPGRVGKQRRQRIVHRRRAALFSAAQPNSGAGGSVRAKAQKPVASRASLEVRRIMEMMDLTLPTTALGLPLSLKPFFQEYAFERIDPEEHWELVIERTLAYGDRRELRWLFERYGTGRLRDWVRRMGWRRLPRRPQG